VARQSALRVSFYGEINFHPVRDALCRVDASAKDDIGVEASPAATNCLSSPGEAWRQGDSIPHVIWLPWDFCSRPGLPP
jgi:hypothetical protein